MIMRNFFRSVLVIASLALIVTACKKDDPEPVKPELTISEADKSQSFNAEAGSKTIAVTTNGDYTATPESGKDWISITGKTEKGLTINVTEYTGYEPRNAKVTLALTGVESIEITVTQIGLAPALVIDNTTFSFAYTAVDTLVPVTTNGEYTVTVATDAQSWVTIEDKTATGFRIKVAQNPTSAGRIATVTVALTGSTLTTEITIAQLLQPVLTVEPSGNIVVNSSLETVKVLSIQTLEGAEYIVTVTKAPTDTVEWLTLEKGSDALAVKIAQRTYYPDLKCTPFGNDGFVSAELPERKATVTISVNGIAGATPVTFDVIQGGNLDKSKMGEYYLSNDNQTLWGDAEVKGIHMMFNNISYAHTYDNRTTRDDYYITTPNKDGTTVETPNDQSWELPFYFTMDLGVSTYLNSFKISPRISRPNRKWEYGVGNPYQFAVWGTNEDPRTNPNSFVKLGDFTCGYVGETLNVEVDDVNEDGTPKLNEDGTPVKKWVPEPITDAGRSAIVPDMVGLFNAITDEACHMAARGYDFALAQTETPVRYLRFEIKKVWGMVDVKDPATQEVIGRAPVTYVNIAELWFWGDPVPAAGN
jgi:hypothetical protein